MTGLEKLCRVKVSPQLLVCVEEKLICQKVGPFHLWTTIWGKHLPLIKLTNSLTAPSSPILHPVPVPARVSAETV